MLNLTTPPDFLKLLAHELRWQLLVALAHSDHRVQELVARLERPMNLVSYHLKQLRDQGLVHERRSSADGRDVYYTLDLARLNRLYYESGQALHPALGQGVNRQPEATMQQAQPPLRVLFLCTHNSARSQMAEGLLRHLGGEGIEVSSAGNQPAAVHPLAVQAMAETGIDISGQRAKHLDEFAGQTFDLVITVCDRVRENCPLFPGDPEQIHWSIPDPLAGENASPAAYQRFATIAQELRTRVTYLLLTQRERMTKAPLSMQAAPTKAKVLFLCTGNAARSQMAEAWLKHYGGQRYEVHSAGFAPKGAIHPLTLAVMAERGLDLADQRCKDVTEYLGRTNFHYLITVCGRDEADCPTAFLNSGGERLEWDFADPVAFVGSAEETIATFRRVRNQIETQIQQWLASQA